MSRPLKVFGVRRPVPQFVLATTLLGVLACARPVPPTTTKPEGQAVTGAATEQAPEQCLPGKTWDGVACGDGCPAGLHFDGANCVHSDGMPCFTGCGAEYGLAGPDAAAGDGPPASAYGAASTIAKLDLSICKMAGGPVGVGHAIVTFANTGAVRAVRIGRAPFAGTGVARCVAAQLELIRVAPFRGPDVDVSSAFAVR